MKRKINKEKVKKKQSYKERLREKIRGATLNYRFTFGKYRDWECGQVCEEDPQYIRWCMQKKILDFGKEVIDYMIKCEREMKENLEKQRAEARRKREEAQRAYRDRAQDHWDNFWSRRFRQEAHQQQRTFHSSATSTASVKVVSPASQWDYLPDKQRYGKILGIQGGTQITKQAIRDLYRKKMLEYHPDKHERSGEEIKKLSNEMTIKIQEAYEYFQRVYGI